MVCRLAAGLICLCWWSAVACAQTPEQLDEQLLKRAGIPTDNQGLLDFFRKRALKDGDRERLMALVRQLGSKIFKEREQAARDLVLQGPVALPFLKDGLKTGDAETQVRADRCVKEIERTMGPEQPVAAARLLALRQAPAAMEVLFNYLPYAEEPWIEEEVLASLGRLTIRQGKIDPLLLGVLKDPLAPRRAAAVYILARRGDLAERDTVRQFLADPSPLVQQRAAEGLIGKHLFKHLEEVAAADEALLKTHKMGTDPPALPVGTTPKRIHAAAHFSDPEGRPLDPTTTEFSLESPGPPPGQARQPRPAP